MHLFSASDLTHGYDDRTLFRDLKFGMASGDRVAIVGPNGSGKSTLLRIVAGDIAPDAGSVVFANDARVTYLPQSPRPAADATTLQVAAGGATSVARHDAEAMLDRLAVPPGAAMGTLSGGQRRRVALARVLLPASDLLILDEPTNHLDADTIDWLEDELRRRTTGLLLVTHDRYLLQRLTNRLLDLEDTTPVWVEGSYADVVASRLARREARERADRVRSNLLRKELAWLRRGPKARTSKPKFRLEQARTLQEAAPVGEPPGLDLGTGRRRLGSRVLDAEGVTVTFPDGTTVLRDIDLALGPGERLGVVGPNGAGKTTLLRALAGDLAPASGTVRWGTTVELAVYDQEAAAAPSQLRVLDTITAIAEWIPLANGERLGAATLAERFGFTPALQQATVARLSGGERRRLALLHLLVRAPNVIMLDEPTNDLDIETLQRLEDHLDAFRGTLVVASHDRYVLDRLTDQLVAIEDARLRACLDWDSYREAHHERRIATATATTPSSADSRTADDNRRRQEQRRLARSLEQRMGRLQQQQAQLDKELAAAGADYGRAAALTAALAEVRGELADVEHSWLEAVVEVEDP
jgi:ATP-binding cassette subfamily F protein uup